MPTEKKHKIQRNKRHKATKAMINQEVIFITKSQVAASKTLFPEKLKKVNKLLEKATLLS